MSLTDIYPHNLWFQLYDKYDKCSLQCRHIKYRQRKVSKQNYQYKPENKKGTMSKDWEIQANIDVEAGISSTWE